MIRRAREEDPLEAEASVDGDDLDGLQDGELDGELDGEAGEGSLDISAFGDTVTVTCPYCFEAVELLLEVEIAGEMVWDCEVCCNPWQLNVRRAGGQRMVEVERLQ